jgi:hypothetical protein
LKGHNVKLRSTTCAVALAALTSTVAIAASADTVGAQDPVSIQEGGRWEYKGSDVFTEQSKVFYSGGGEFKVCLAEGSKHGQYRLKEQDDWDVDDNVRTYDHGDTVFYFPTTAERPECFTYRDLDGYRDGDDGLAEFYLIKWTGGNSIVETYD